jgi:hypothetical protein
MSKYKLTVTVEIGQQSFTYAMVADEALELADAYAAFKEFGGSPENLASGFNMLENKIKEIRAKREEEQRKAAAQPRPIYEVVKTPPATNPVPGTI